MDIRTSGIEDQIIAIFKAVLFDPLVRVIKQTNAQVLPRSLRNAAGDDAVKQALRSGLIQYQAGVFSGQFSAAISRGLRALGAAYDKRSSTYRLQQSQVPTWVTAEASVYAVGAKAAHQALHDQLNEIEKNLDQTLETKPLSDTIPLEQIEHGFQEVAKHLEVKPVLTQGAKERLAEDYNANMDLWIDNFTRQEIQKLRGVVEKNAQQGFRYDVLVSKIQQRYDVSENKARFLARQETALFMSKFRRERFADAGVTQYRWSTSHDEKVRKRHQDLDGKVFSYANPPIVDKDTGRRGNPGEDFNCRCRDIPIVEPLAAAKA